MAKTIPELITDAIYALQRVAMAHPKSDPHSVDMYQTCESARLGLLDLEERLKNRQKEIMGES